VVNIILGEEGEGQSSFIRVYDDSHVSHVLAMDLISAYINNNSSEDYMPYTSWKGSHTPMMAQ